jgi:hypothetical protein
LRGLLAALAAVLVGSATSAAPLEILGEEQAKLAFAPEDFRGFVAGTDIVGKKFIAIEVTAEFRNEMREFTSTQVGKQVRLLFCGTENMRVILEAPYTDDIIWLDGFGRDDLPRVSAILRGEELCPLANE